MIAITSGPEAEPSPLARPLHCSSRGEGQLKSCSFLPLALPLLRRVALRRVGVFKVSPLASCSLFTPRTCRAFRSSASLRASALWLLWVGGMGYFHYIALDPNVWPLVHWSSSAGCITAIAAPASIGTRHGSPIDFSHESIAVEAKHFEGNSQTPADPVPWLGLVAKRKYYLCA